MPIPTAILFTLALLAAILATVGWWSDPVAPELGAWFVAKLTEGGLWTGLFLFLMVAGYFTWRRGRDGGSGGPP